MNKLEIFKAVTGFIAGAGTTHIIGGIVDSNVSQEHIVHKTITFVGKIVIGSIVSGIVVKHTDAKIDSAAAWLTNAIELAQSEK